MDLSVSQFTNNLFFEVADELGAHENVFISPWSIYCALSLTLAGADGNTLVQMLHGMALHENANDLHKQLGDWQQNQLSSQGNVDSVTLSLANRVYADEHYELLNDYVSLLKKNYHADVEKVPFQSNTDEAIKVINQWVEKQTNSKIKDLLSNDVVNALTRVILVNAVYFKGKWLKAFKPESTKPGQFHTLDGASQNVQMMFQSGKFDYAELPNLHVKLLWMPFKDKTTNLLIILPDNKDGINQLKEHLKADSKNLHELLHTDKRWPNIPIELSVPKMKLETSCSLKKSLSGPKLGMVEMFSQSGANFSKMTSKNDLFVSEVIHKAFFEMDEEGAEAAAATAAVMMLRCAPPRPRRFDVDHPFLLALVNQHNTPLFMGQVLSLA